jgi:hypothetical protein
MLKNGVIWDVTPCDSYKTDVSEELSAVCSSETSSLTRTTRRNIPEDTILHSHSRENLKSYMLYMAMRTVELLKKKKAE